MTFTSQGAQGTCPISQAALLGALAEGGGALQGATLVLVLKDGRGELLQAAAQQVRGLLGPLVAGKLLAPSYGVERTIWYLGSSSLGHLMPFGSLFPLDWGVGIFQRQNQPR